MRKMRKKQYKIRVLKIAKTSNLRSLKPINSILNNSKIQSKTFKKSKIRNFFSKISIKYYKIKNQQKHIKNSQIENSMKRKPKLLKFEDFKKNSQGKFLIL